MNVNAPLTPRHWGVILLLALAIAAVPQLVMEVFFTDNDGGANIGGGLLALLSPMILTFILGLLHPLPWKAWAISSAVALLFSSIFYLLRSFSLSEVATLLPFDIFLSLLFAIAGVLSSTVRVAMEEKKRRGEQV